MAHKGLELVGHLSSKELKERYRKCQGAKEARRWQALWLISEGATTLEAAKAVGFASSWVRRFVGRYNESGPSAIIDGHKEKPGGGKYRLSEAQQRQLLKALEKAPPDGGLWSGPKVAAWIESKTGKKAHPQLGWQYLRRLGKTAQTPRRRHTNSASEPERKAYKKSSAAK
jgi:transposase